MRRLLVIFKMENVHAEIIGNLMQNLINISLILIKLKRFPTFECLLGAYTDVQYAQFSYWCGAPRHFFLEHYWELVEKEKDKYTFDFGVTFMYD